MKRFLLISFTTLLILLLAGCNNKASIGADTRAEQPYISDEAAVQTDENASGIVEIKEKLFIAQCNDIYLNPDDYKNKTIKLEGLYNEYTDLETGKTKSYVIRYGPGCCGNDGVAGFEILFEGDKPKAEDWIEVAGIIQMMEENGVKYVALKLSSLKILDVRGAETVAD